MERQEEKNVVQKLACMVVKVCVDSAKIVNYLWDLKLTRYPVSIQFKLKSKTSSFASEIISQIKNVRLSARKYFETPIAATS